MKKKIMKLAHLSYALMDMGISMGTKREDIEELKRRVEALEIRVRILEKPRVSQDIDPLIDPWKKSGNPNTWPYKPLKPLNRCPKCQIELSQAMGYVCSSPDCPCGLGSPYSTTCGGHCG